MSLVIEVPIQLLPLKPHLHWRLQRFSSRSHPHQRAPEVCRSPAITLPIDYPGCPTCSQVQKLFVQLLKQPAKQETNEYDSSKIFAQMPDQVCILHSLR